MFSARICTLITYNAIGGKNRSVKKFSQDRVYKSSARFVPGRYSMGIVSSRHPCYKTIQQGMELFNKTVSN